MSSHLRDLERLSEVLSKIKNPWIIVALSNLLAEIGGMKTVTNSTLNEWIKFFMLCASFILLTYIAEILVSIKKEI